MTSPTGSLAGSVGLGCGPAAPRTAPPPGPATSPLRPWGNLAIFYRDSPYASGLVRLGSLDSGIEELAGRDGDFTVTIQAIDGNS